MNAATKLVLALMAIGFAGIALVAIGLGSSPRMAGVVCGVMLFVGACKLLSITSRWRE